MHPGKLAALQEWMKRGKIMTSARLSTEALESCFRRVIREGVKEGKPPALTAQVAFCVAKRGEMWYTMPGVIIGVGHRSWRRWRAHRRTGGNVDDDVDLLYHGADWAKVGAAPTRRASEDRSVSMNKSSDTQLKISASEFLDSLFLEELGDQTKYDPEVVKLVKQHLGQESLHSRAGVRLAEALVQLAKARAMEEDQ